MLEHQEEVRTHGAVLQGRELRSSSVMRQLMLGDLEPNDYVSSVRQVVSAIGPDALWNADPELRSLRRRRGLVSNDVGAHVMRALTIVLAVAVTWTMVRQFPAGLGWLSFVVPLLVACWVLLSKAWRLHRSRDRLSALRQRTRSGHEIETLGRVSYFEPGSMEQTCAMTPWVRRLILHHASDERLLRCVVQGDGLAFVSIERRYLNRLEVFALQFGLDYEDACRVAEDSLSVGAAMLRMGLRPHELRAWLYRLVRNQALRHLQQRGASGTSTVICDHELRLLMLRDVEQLSSGQIAVQLAISRDEVNQRLLAARQSVAQAVDVAESWSPTWSTPRLHLGRPGAQT